MSISHISQNQKFHTLFSSHARDFISFLWEEGLNFSITCDVDFVSFDPPLSESLRQKLGRVAMFVLSGYSFESLDLKSETFSFEAGLISDEGDIGTILEVPYMSILQILLHDEVSNHPIPVFINPFEMKPSQTMEKSQDSMKAILSRNADLLKGKK